MSLGSIIVRLSMQTAEFETDSGRAAKIAERRAKEIDAAFRKAGIAIGAALGTAIVGVTKSIKNSIDRMDELSKAAQRAQMPTEEFSRLAYAGDLADVAMSDLVTSMGLLAKAQGDASRGLKTQSDAFEQLGISFKNADGSLRSTSEVFKDFADVYQRFKGSPEVLAAGMQIFGSSFQNLIPLLKDGRAGLEDMAEEADRLGYTIGTEAGQQAEAFNKNLSRLKTVVAGLANQVAADLLPDLVSLSGGFVDSANKGDRLKDTASEIADGFRVLADAAHIISSAFELAGTAIATFLAQGHAVVKFMKGDFRGAAALYREASLGFGEEFNEAFGLNKPPPAPERPTVVFAGEGPEPDGLFRNPPNLPDIPLPPKPPRSSGGSAKSKREMPNFAETATEDLRRLVEAETRAMDQFDALAATLSGPLAEAFYRHEVNLKEITELGEKLGRSSSEIADLKEREAKRYREEADAIRERLDPAAQMLRDLQFEYELIGKTNAERQTAIQLRGMDAESIAKYGDEILAANKKLESESEARMVFDDLRGFTDDFVADSIYNFGKAGDAFEDYVDRIKALAAKLLAQKAVEWLFGALFGTPDATSGGFGAFTPNTGGFAKGGYTGAGGKYTPAGIVHAGEYVINAESTRKLGLAYLDRLNGYANGGYVAPVSGMPTDGRPQVEVNVIKQGSGNGDPSVDVMMEGGKMIVNVTLAEVERRLATPGSTTNKAMKAGLAGGVRYG